MSETAKHGPHSRAHHHEPQPVKLTAPLELTALLQLAAALNLAAPLPRNPLIMATFSLIPRLASIA